MTASYLRQKRDYYCELREKATPALATPQQLVDLLILDGEIANMDKELAIMARDRKSIVANYAVMIGAAALIVATYAVVWGGLIVSL
jgi:hypothetical protein